MPISFVAQPFVAKEKKKLNKTPKPSKAHPYVQAGRKRRIVSSESELFGSKLFEPIIQKEREIVITFPPVFTENRTRFSACGRFAYKTQLIDGEYIYTLYHLLDPILEPDHFLVLIPSEKILIFENLDCVALEDNIIKVIRGEIEQEKNQILTEFNDQQKQKEEDKNLVEEIKDAQEDIFASIISPIVETFHELPEVKIAEPQTPPIPVAKSSSFQLVFKKEGE